MNLKEIRNLIDLMNENDLNELEIERDGMKIKLKKAAGEGAPVYSRNPADFTIQSAPSVGSTEKKETVADTSNRNEIQSPMVGTFYRAPSPEAPSFAEIGQTVDVGQVVCIIEAMKLMNEIKSEIRGKIVEAPIENAQPVEFGQALFIVEPV